jgi:CRP-like cAMP-binding protein
MGKGRMTNRFVNKLRGIAELDDTDIAALIAATATGRNVPAKYDIIREGDTPGPVFVILEGWACRYKILPGGTRQILAFLMPGDSCDLHAGLLDEMDHSIQAITPARVAAITRVEMDAIMDKHPRIARAMYIAQLIDEGTMRAWITSMGRRASMERVAHLICELYIRARNVGLAQEATFSFPVSQILLADSLGMTSVHINRVFRELRVSGAMTLSRGNLEIIDPGKIVRIAGFDDNYLHRRLRTT